MTEKMLFKTTCKIFFKSKLFYSRIVPLLIIILMPLTFILYLGGINSRRYNPDVYNTFPEKFLSRNHKYLINTSTCKIPQDDAFSPETENLIHPKKYTSCSNNLPLLTYVKKHDKDVTLHINQTAKALYSFFRIHCCYSVVQRASSSSGPDDNVRVSDCISFQDQVVIPSPIIYVTCENIFFIEVYSNVHYIISQDFIQKKNNIKLKSNSVFNVLLVGIDSISKLNLERMMPKTYQLLEQNEDFINMRGFVKVGLNTLPNLIAMLSGTDFHVWKKCQTPHLDDCYNIWTVFQKTGYITAYGEDAIEISSFNYHSPGFRFPPTDLYFRPYMIAAEGLGVRSREHMNYCAGPETEAERIMNLAKEFQMINHPKFGLFWMNSFSHDELNMPSAMDEKVSQFLKDISQHLNDTIFFFFSDHGIRFGDIRLTHTGWLEERLPFFYIYVPESFKKQYTTEYRNLLVNSNRLTNFYDMYMTLQDVLFFAESTFKVEPSLECPLCQSVFEEISEDRSCKDAAISEEWCVCNVSCSNGYLEDPWKTDAGQLLVEEVNNLVAKHPNGSQCRQFKLKEVLFAGVAQSDTILVRIKTYPEASFEASFEIFEKSVYGLKLLSGISRLDRHAQNSWCVKKSSLESYCYCKDSKWYATILNKINYF